MEDSKLLAYIREHKGLITGGVIGLLLAIFFITYGFFRTLFIIICVVIGAALGARKENRDKVVSFIEELFGQKKG